MHQICLWLHQGGSATVPRVDGSRAGRQARCAHLAPDDGSYKLSVINDLGSTIRPRLGLGSQGKALIMPRSRFRFPPFPPKSVSWKGAFGTSYRVRRIPYALPAFAPGLISPQVQGTQPRRLTCRGAWI